MIGRFDERFGEWLDDSVNVFGPIGRLGYIPPAVFAQAIFAPDIFSLRDVAIRVADFTTSVRLFIMGRLQLALTNGGGKDTATVENAKVALRNFVRQSHTSIIVNDPEHIQAYMTLRGLHGRVTGEQLVRSLDAAKEAISHGGNAAMKFWAIPKVNFPKGVAPACRRTLGRHAP